MEGTNETLSFSLDKTKALRDMVLRLTWALPLMLALAWGGAYGLPALNRHIGMQNPELFAPRPLFWFYCTIMLVGLVWAAFGILRFSQPMLVLSPQGLTFHIPFQSGFIRWDEVERVEVYRFVLDRYVGISPRDPMAWFGRLPSASRLWQGIWAMYTALGMLPVIGRLYRSVRPISLPESYLPLPTAEMLRLIEEYHVRATGGGG